MDQQFDARVATTATEVIQCFKLCIELFQTIDKMDIDLKGAKPAAEYYLQNSDNCKVILVEETKSKTMVAFMIANRAYCMERNQMTHRPVSLIVKKGYRQRSFASKIFDISNKITESWGLNYTWGYHVRRNNRANNIYDSWGLISYYDIGLFFMDLALRKDRLTQRNQSYEKNFKFFESNFVDCKFQNSFGLKVSRIKKEHLSEIERLAPKLRNLNNSRFQKVSFEGIKQIVDGVFNGEALVITQHNKIFGVVGLMKYYFLGRNGYDLWMTGLYVDPNFQEPFEELWTEAYLSVQRYFLTNLKQEMEADVKQTRKIFQYFNFILYCERVSNEFGRFNSIVNFCV